MKIWPRLVPKGRESRRQRPVRKDRFWYEWRISVHALDANLNTPGTCYVFEALQRIRRLGAVKYLATQNPLVTLSLVDLVSYIDSFNVSTTNEQQTVLVNNIGFRGGKTMTVGGKPYKINPTEQLSVSLKEGRLAA